MGAVADNFGETIKQKIFHAEIVVDNEAVKKEVSEYVKIPVIMNFKDEQGNDRMHEQIECNYSKIKLDVKDIVRLEIERISKDENLKHLLKNE